MNEIDASGLDSDLLRSFVLVARHGSITRAAQALHRTQSAVSVQMKRLEMVLGTDLLVRQARGVSLTPAGERLFSQANQILAMLDKLAREYRSAPIAGPVTVGIPEEYGGEMLTSILGGFSRANASAEVSVRCSFSTGFPDAIRKGELDLALYVSGPADTKGEFLASEETVWAAARTFAVPPAEEVLPVALFDRSCWWHDAAVSLLEASGRTYRIAFSSESVAGVKAAVAAELAVAVLGRSCLDRGMRILTPDERFPPLGPSRLVLLTGARREAPPVAAMASAIRAAFRSGRLA